MVTEASLAKEGEGRGFFFISRTFKLTSAAILIEVSNPRPVADRVAVTVEESGGTIGQRPMVHVIELAVVVFSRRWSQIKERPAKKLALRATSSTASVGTISLEKKCTHIKKITLGEQITYNELLVDVKLRFDVCRYFL